MKGMRGEEDLINLVENMYEAVTQFARGVRKESVQKELEEVTSSIQKIVTEKLFETRMLSRSSPR